MRTRNQTCESQGSLTRLTAPPGAAKPVHAVSEDSSSSPVRDAGFTPPWNSDYFLNLAEELHASSEPPDAAVQEPQAFQAPNLAEVVRKAHNWRLENRSGNLASCIGFGSWTKIIDIYEDEIGSQYPFMDLDIIRDHVKAACQDTSSDPSPVASHMEHTLFLILAVVAVLEDPDISQLADVFTQKSRQYATAKAQDETVDDHTIRLLILVVSPSMPIRIGTSLFLTLSV